MTTRPFACGVRTAGVKTRRWRAVSLWALVAGLALGAAACGDDEEKGSPTGPSATVNGVTVQGASSFTVLGATAQFSAMATLSDGSSEDRTRTATWQSSAPAVATVSATGLVTAIAAGSTSISATVDGETGRLAVTVKVAAARAPDPAAGQRLPMPDVQSFVRAAAAARPDLLAQSCPQGLKYVTNPWLDYIVGQLRTLDTRWGYNAKPTRTAADNNGVPVVAAGDEVAYHFSAGPDEGSTDVYLIDVLEGHCGPTPRVTYRVFTGEEPGRWTGAGKY